MIDYLKLRNRYCDQLNDLISNVNEKVASNILSCNVQTFDLQNTYLYCISEFNNPNLAAEDDYGIQLMVLYQNYDPYSKIRNEQGDVFIYAALLRAGGETVSFFDPIRLNESQNNFEGNLLIIEKKISEFIVAQEKTIIELLTRDYLTR